MAVLYPNGEAYHVAHLGRTQTFAVGATATTATGAVLAQILRITADIAINFVYGSSPTAATTDARLPAGVVEYIQTQVGDVFSAKTTTGTATGVLGTVWITEGS